MPELDAENCQPGTGNCKLQTALCTLTPEPQCIMYTQFFGFIEKPFNLTPDPRFLYLSPGHQEALASMIYGIKEKRGFISIIGEIGIGKTTLLHTLFKELGGDVKTVFIFNTKINFTQLLQNILIELNLTPVSENKTALINQLNDYLIERLSANEIVALIIDEAQNLSPEVLEELRMLSNLETTKEKLLQIVLVGQPELDVILRSHNLRQLKQRIAINCYLTALNREEQIKYIIHRLTIAGHNGNQIFTAKALELICKHSRGIPRLINIFCDNALLSAYGKERYRVDVDIIEEAVADYEQPKMLHQTDAKVPLSEYGEKKRSYRKVLIITICMLLGILVSFIFAVYFANISILFSQLRSAAITELGFLLSKGRLAPDDEPPATHIQQPLEMDPFEQEATTTEPMNTPLQENDLNIPGVRSDEVASEVPEPAPLPESVSAPAIPSANLEPEPRNDFFIEKHEKTITAKGGDIVSALASQEYGSLTDTLCDIIKRANPEIDDLDRIYVGQKIIFPPLELEGLIINEDNGTFSIHFATFSANENALRFQKMLSNHDLVSAITSVKIVGSQPWYRVTVGKFANRPECIEYAQNIGLDSALLPFPVDVIQQSLKARSHSPM